MQITQVNIFLVSDCTGDTLCSVSRSVINRFANLKATECLYPWTRTTEQIDYLIQKALEQDAIIFYTIVDRNLREYLKLHCNLNNVRFVSVLSHAIVDFAAIIGEEPLDYPVSKFNIDENYFERINAINYAILHDDGQVPNNLNEADIIICGVSRTSKSPTSIYLAYRGYKTANIPFVNEEQMDLMHIPQNKFVVGLTMDKSTLAAIRRNRKLGMSAGKYLDMDSIADELERAKRFFHKKAWSVIDTTNKSIEETASHVINHYNEYKMNGRLRL